MGTNNYLTIYRGQADLQAAYDDRWAEADAEYGHQQGYSGEINNSAGFRQVVEQPMSEAAAVQYAYDHAGQCEKRGPAAAIPLCAGGERRAEEVTVTIPNEGRGDDVVRAAVLAKLRLRKGEHVLQVFARGADWRPSPSRPQVEVPKAKAVTTYRVIDADRRLGERVFAEGFATQAEARAAAVDLAASGRVTVPMQIRAEVVRESGEALLTVTPVIKRWEVTVTVEIEGPSPAPGKRVGWLFYGAAPC